MHPPTVPTLDGIAPELLEAILLQTLDGTTQTNHRQLLRLQLVSKKLCMAARRLVFRDVVIDSPKVGRKVLEILLGDRSLAQSVRSLMIKQEAFARPLFTRVCQDDLLRSCTSLRSFDSPYAAFTSSSKEWQEEEEGEGDDTASTAADGTAQVAVKRSKQTSTDLLAGLPANLTSITICNAPFAVPSAAISVPLLFNHLTALSLERITLAPGLFDLLAPAAGAASLERIKIWCVEGIVASDITRLVQKVGGGLKELSFRPVASKQGKKLGNTLLNFCYLPVLESISFGEEACDVDIFALLPSTLKTLAISLNDMYPVPLGRIADVVEGHLHSLGGLSLCSIAEPPPPLPITYPPRGMEDGTSLRELRLSHLHLNLDDLEPFLARLGPTLFKLTLDHLHVHIPAMYRHCPSLRRFENGHDYLGALDSSKPYFDGLDAPFLHRLRIHLSSGVNLPHLVETVSTYSQKCLQTLELVGTFSPPARGSWQSGELMDELFEVCREGGVRLSFNGWPVESRGDLWGALARREK